MGKNIREKFKAFLSRDFREQIEKRDKLRKILKKMRMQQKDLERTLMEEWDPEKQEQLRKKLHLIRMQRSKGINLLQELKSGSDDT